MVLPTFNFEKTPSLAELNESLKEAERRKERTKRSTQKKVLAVIFAGFMAAAGTGFVVHRAHEGVRKTAQAAGEFITESAVGVINKVEHAFLTEEERGMLKEIDSLLVELKERIDHLSDMVEKVSALRSYPPKRFIEFVRAVPQRSALERREPPEVSGFEKNKIRNEVLLRMLKDGYPASWYKHIKSVRFEAKNETSPGAYGRGENSVVCANADYSKPTVITFFLGCSREEKAQVLGHEMGHAVSWEGSDTLSLHDRLLFLNKILTRIDAPDRFISRDAEDIDQKNQQLRNYLRATEYWAEIVNEYLNRPPYYYDGGRDPGRLPEKNLELVRWFLKKTDPGFDAKKAKKVRADFVSGRFSQGKWFPSELFITEKKGG